MSFVIGLVALSRVVAALLHTTRWLIILPRGKPGAKISDYVPQKTTIHMCYRYRLFISMIWLTH